MKGRSRKARSESGLALELAVDHARRTAIRANHSATHLLHEALRLVLGDHVAQKGSLVAGDRLRFDFAHLKPISQDELTRIEDIANRAVLENAPVVTRLMGVEDAINSGARALFGEKYGDEVRVVSMGYAQDRDDGGEGANRAFSVELCGGTHVARTGDIGLITIVSEGAVAAGVRRIEAKTATEARRYLNARAAHLREVAALLKSPEDDAPKRLAALIEDRRKIGTRSQRRPQETGDGRRERDRGERLSRTSAASNSSAGPCRALN